MMERLFRFDVPRPAPLPPRQFYHFRIHCAGDCRFDVQAANREDAVAHVKKRSRARVNQVELVGEVKNHWARPLRTPS